MIIFQAILAGILYRLGGTNKGTLWRDIGVSIVTLLTMLSCGLLGNASSLKLAIVLILTFGLSWGALASYWKQDEKKWGYWAHALGLSLALLPYAWATGHWIGFGVRTLVLTSLITLTSEILIDANAEEFLRGFLTIISLSLI